jgi:peroxiredoxin
MFAAVSRAQTTIPTDSTTIFKNQEGKVLTADEAKELMKTKFSIKQDMVNGKKVITIIPPADAELAKFNAQMKAFREGLIGKPVRSFKLTDLNNKKWNSKTLKGQVVVMNFWFTACKPCVQEMPLLNEVVAAYKDRNVVFLAPGLDKEEQIRKFLNQYKFDYNIVASAGDYTDELKIENFPTHLVIDKQGIIRQVFLGYSDDINKKLKEEIEKLL